MNSRLAEMISWSSILTLGRRFHQRGAATAGTADLRPPGSFRKGEVVWTEPWSKRHYLISVSLDGFDAVSDRRFHRLYVSVLLRTRFNVQYRRWTSRFLAEQVHDMADHIAASGDELNKLRTLAYCMHQCVEKCSKLGAAPMMNLKPTWRTCTCTDRLSGPTTRIRFQICRSVSGRSTKPLELILSTQNTISVSRSLQTLRRQLAYP